MSFDPCQFYIVEHFYSEILYTYLYIFRKYK